MGDDDLQRGLELRRQVMGGDYVDGAMSREDDFQRYITEHAWGAVWADDRLALRERSIATLAMTAALGRWDVFEHHLRGARNNGLTAEQLHALVLHIAVYAGAPAAYTADRLLREALEREDHAAAT